MALFTFNDCFRKTDIVNIFPSVVVSDGYVVDHYNKTRSGPRIVPCGTPPFTNSQSDNTDPNFTLCRLCMRKSITQLIGELPMPSNCIFFYEELMVNSIKCPTSFPGLSYEDEARHEKALVWAGHVTTQKMAVFDSYSSRSGEIFFNEISVQVFETNKQPKYFSIDIIYV